MTPKGRRCYFNRIEGTDYCPGHAEDPDGPCDVEAVGAYQQKHGVDYPCGKPDDTHRIFDPNDYYPTPEDDVRPVSVPGVPGADETYRVTTPEERDAALETLDRALAGVGMNDWLAGTDPIPLPIDCDRGDTTVCCPLGRCYYDEQHARRARVEKALTRDAWLARLDEQNARDSLDYGETERALYEAPSPDALEEELVKADRRDRPPLPEGMTLEDTKAGLARVQEEREQLVSRPDGLYRGGKREAKFVGTIDRDAKPQKKRKKPRPL